MKTYMYIYIYNFLYQKNIYIHIYSVYSNNNKGMRTVSEHFGECAEVKRAACGAACCATESPG